MRLVARAPLDMIAGRDRRPGDMFELDDAAAAQLVASGACDKLVEGQGAASADKAPADTKPKRKA